MISEAMSDCVALSDLERQQRWVAAGCKRTRHSQGGRGCECMRCLFRHDLESLFNRYDDVLLELSEAREGAAAREGDKPASEGSAGRSYDEAVMPAAPPSDTSDPSPPSPAADPHTLKAHELLELLRREVWTAGFMEDGHDGNVSAYTVIRHIENIQAWFAGEVVV